MSINKLSPAATQALTIAGFVVSIVILLWQIFGTTGHIDMIIYRAGAEAYLAGGSLYNEPFAAYDLKLPFIYPPFAALLLAPFTFVSADAAGYLMVGSAGILLLICISFLLHYLITEPKLRWVLISWAWAFSLLAEPVRQNASFAQINVWLLALVFLDICQ